MARARRTEQPLALAFVDVDRLKVINDSHGHAAGDRMLLSVADTFRANLRSYDLIIRYGGDEFVCAMTGLTLPTRPSGSPLVNPILAEAPEHGSVTVGLAELRPEDSAEDLVARADAGSTASARSPTPDSYSSCAGRLAGPPAEAPTGDRAGVDAQQAGLGSGRPGRQLEGLEVLRLQVEGVGDVVARPLDDDAPSAAAGGVEPVDLEGHPRQGGAGEHGAADVGADHDAAAVTDVVHREHERLAVGDDARPARPRWRPTGPGTPLRSGSAARSSRSPCRCPPRSPVGRG